MGLPLSEITAVRFASRGGALVVAALFCLLALLPFATPRPDENAGGASTISVAVEYRTPPQVQPLHSAPQARTIPANFTAAASEPSEGKPGDASSHMWLDGAAGRVHFVSERDYLRCLDAAIAHLQIDGCPAPPTGPSLTDHPPPRAGAEILLREDPAQAYAHNRR